ncbi:MAG: clostripain-related cysteine peptidase [Bacteroidota bacterium]
MKKTAIWMLATVFVLAWGTGCGGDQGSSTSGSGSSDAPATQTPSDVEVPESSGKGWTFMVYIVGSDLESQSGAGGSDLMEMMQVGSTPDLNVIVCTGGANAEGWHSVQQQQVLAGDMALLEDYGQVDMASQPTLTRFVTSTVQQFPAEKYGLILWNHGMGVNGFGHDENSHNDFTIPELRATLDGIKAETGIKYEVLGFDACLMATIEVAANFQDHANYMVASEELEPGHGWNYTPILEILRDNPDLGGADLGRVITHEFLEHARKNGTDGITLSTVDMSAVGEILAAVNEMVSHPGLGQGVDFLDLERSRGKAESYGRSVRNPERSADAVDLADLAMELGASNPEFASVTGSVVEAIEKAVVHRVNDDTRPNARGLTIFLPYDQFTDEGSR